MYVEFDENKNKTTRRKNWTTQQNKWKKCIAFKCPSNGCKLQWTRPERNVMRLMLMIFHFINAVVYSYSCIWIYCCIKSWAHRRRLRLKRRIQAEFTHTSGHFCFNKFCRLPRLYCIKRNTFAFVLHVVVVAYCRMCLKSISRNEEVIVDIWSLEYVVSNATSFFHFGFIKSMNQISVWH